MFKYNYLIYCLLFTSYFQADKLYEIYQGGPRLKLKLSLCWKCVKNKCALLYTKTITSEQNKNIVSVLQNWDPPTDNLE